jgi:hypothetical protein
MTESRTASVYILCVLSGLLLAPTNSPGQIIIGRVVEEGNRTPVAGAHVQLVASHSKVEARTTVSDSGGLFRLEVQASGQYGLRVQHVGFRLLDTPRFTVGPGESLSIEVRLSTVAIPLEPLIVLARSRHAGLAEFEGRRLTHSSGRFITRDQIDRHTSTRTTELLRSMPGVEIMDVTPRGASRTRSLVRVRGGGRSCEPALFIDGIAVRQGVDSTIDDLLNPDMLIGVEVYTSAAVAPVRYAHPGACGVMLFWTGAGEAGRNKWSWKVIIGSTILAALAALALAR